MEPLDIIAVGAHPDDVEIGCGGTLAALVKLGYRVGIIDLTDGEPTPLCPDPIIRRQEALAAAEALGVHERVILDLPNRRLFDSYEARVKLAIEFRKYRPQLVLGIHGRTPTASPDHWQAMQITDAAVFYSRLTKWDDQFAGLPPHKIAKQAWFPLTFELATLLTLPHAIVQDISGSWEQKVQAIRCYQTQFPPEKDSLFERVVALGQSIGQTAGFRVGELISSSRSLGTDDLLRSL